MFSWPTLLLIFPVVSAFPLERRANTACGKFDTIAAAPYSLLTNLWGASDATSGSQCSTLESVQGNHVKWSTKWTWTGNNSVKSFSNVQLNAGINRRLDAITNMPSTWKWSLNSAEGAVVADVAYDLFTSYSPGGTRVNEVMIWLASFDAGPISYLYGADGKSIPIASGLEIAGHVWDVHLGFNGYNVVYSFVPANDRITSFRGDIYKFLKHLVDHGYIASSEYLVVAQAGTEATRGSATFNTTAYHLAIN